MRREWTPLPSPGALTIAAPASRRTSWRLTRVVSLGVSPVMVSAYTAAARRPLASPCAMCQAHRPSSAISSSP